MKDPIVKGSKVIFGPVRLSYCHLFHKRDMKGNSDTDDAKYSCVAIIPKSETATVKALRKAQDYAVAQATAEKWGGKTPSDLESLLKDGDRKEDNPEFADAWLLNAKCKTRPNVVDRKGNAIMDEDEVYSGMWAMVSVTFFGYTFEKIRKGVSVGLNNVMKWKDDDPFGGRSSAASDFAGLIDSDDEDEDNL